MNAHVAQLVERILGKDEVIGPIPIVGSILVAGGKYFLDREIVVGVQPPG